MIFTIIFLFLGQLTNSLEHDPSKISVSLYLIHLYEKRKKRKKSYSLVVHFPPLSRRFMTYLTWLISCHARAL